MLRAGLHKIYILGTTSKY